MNEIEKLKQALRKKKEVKSSSPGDFLPTGIFLLDLALGGGLLPEHVYLFVGDSQAGKSWLMLQLLAEACRNKRFSKHRLIHDNPERGTLMDIPRYFGKSLANRLESPTKQGPSKTLEDFYRNVAGQAKPFIYGLDSEDSLPPEQDITDATTKKPKGSMGMERAKTNSRQLRVAHNLLEGTDSLLIIIKQTRENVGFDSMFNPKTRSGGKALTFYATSEIWFSIRNKIKRTVRGKPRVVGSVLKMHVKKNRVAGRDVAVEIPFYPNVGFDDIGACVNFLVEEGHWKETDGKVVASEFKLSGSREKVISKIEEGNREEELRKIVTDVWADIEADCEVRRKRRYE